MAAYIGEVDELETEVEVVVVVVVPVPSVELVVEMVDSDVSVGVVVHAPRAAVMAISVAAVTAMVLRGRELRLRMGVSFAMGEEVPVAERALLTNIRIMDGAA